MGLAPDPRFSEKGFPSYDRKGAPNIPGNRGPLRFEEGLATDTDLPSDFQQGLMEGMIPAPGSLNHVNPETQFKHEAQTLAERAHPGSAAWIEAPSMLGAFAHGSFTDQAEVRYESQTMSGGRQARRAPTIVTD